MSSNTIEYCGVTITIHKEFKDLINELNTNSKWNDPKWNDDLETYKKGINEEKDKISFHQSNCTKISSLRNRVFANYEWEILKEQWPTISSNISIKVNNVTDAENIYIATTGKLFNLFRSVWEKKKAEAKKDNPEKREKSYPHPYAEINRLFAGFNLDQLCPIVDDNSLKELIKGLVSANYIEISAGEEILLKTGQEKGGWLIRSLIVNQLFSNVKKLFHGVVSKNYKILDSMIC